MNVRTHLGGSVLLIRRIGAVVLALAAVIVMVTMGPDRGDVVSQVDSVLSAADLNESSASGAPQQQVVNGWAAKDLLAIVAKQEPDNRVPALVCLAVLGLALAVFTSPSGTTPSPDGAAGPPPWVPTPPAPTSPPQYPAP
jgi:hypothetical protein